MWHALTHCLEPLLTAQGLAISVHYLPDIHLRCQTPASRHGARASAKAVQGPAYLMMAL